MAGVVPQRMTYAIASVVLTAITAGCLAEPRPDTDDPLADGPDFPRQLAFDGCREILGLWDLDYGEVAPYLPPPGFEPDSFLLPPQDSIGRNASMDLLAIDCSEPTDASLLIPWLTVTPPDHLTHPEADAYRVMLPCIGDAGLAEVLQAWGAPCTVGDTAFTTETGTPAGDTWAFDAQGANFTIRMEGTGAATEEFSEEPVFRQFHVTDRTVCAITHLDLEDHVHWRGHGFTLEADGDVPFPVPDEPGAGLLAMPGFRMAMTPMASDEPGSDACPERSYADDGTNGVH